MNKRRHVVRLVGSRASANQGGGHGPGRGCSGAACGRSARRHPADTRPAGARAAARVYRIYRTGSASSYSTSSVVPNSPPSQRLAAPVAAPAACPPTLFLSLYLSLCISTCGYCQRRHGSISYTCHVPGTRAARTLRGPSHSDTHSDSGPPTAGAEAGCSFTRGRVGGGRFCIVLYAVFLCVCMYAAYGGRVESRRAVHATIELSLPYFQSLRVRARVLTAVEPGR